MCNFLHTRLSHSSGGFPKWVLMVFSLVSFRYIPPSVLFLVFSSLASFSSFCNEKSSRPSASRCQRRRPKKSKRHTLVGHEHQDDNCAVETRTDDSRWYNSRHCFHSTCFFFHMSFCILTFCYFFSAQRLLSLIWLSYRFSWGIFIPP